MKCAIIRRPDDSATILFGFSVTDLDVWTKEGLSVVPTHTLPLDVAVEVAFTNEASYDTTVAMLRSHGVEVYETHHVVLGDSVSGEAVPSVREQMEAQGASEELIRDAEAAQAHYARRDVAALDLELRDALQPDARPMEPLHHAADARSSDQIADSIAALDAAQA